MKKRNNKMVALAIVATIAASSLTLGAKQLTQAVQIRYNNIKVEVDREHKTPNLEPFFLGDSVYVSLRDAGQLIGATVDWDPSNQTVKIDTSKMTSGNQQETAMLKQQLANMSIQLLTTQRERDEYKAELEELKKQQEQQQKVDADAIEKMLTRYYEDEYDVPWIFEVDGDDKGIDLVIKYNSNRYGSEFRRISDTNMKKFLEDICKDIQKQYSALQIDGEIYDVSKRQTDVTFTMASTGRFTHRTNNNTQFTQSKLDEFAKKLERVYSDFPVLDFEGRYDGSSINVRSIELSEKSGEIDAIVEIFIPSFAISYWEGMGRSDRDKLASYLDDILDDIEEEFDTDAVVYIYSRNSSIAEYDGRLTIK